MFTIKIKTVSKSFVELGEYKTIAKAKKAAEDEVAKGVFTNEDYVTLDIYETYQNISALKKTYHSPHHFPF
jgi:hypothetical protein